jgi:cytochrome c-type biogenesis protein
MSQFLQAFSLGNAAILGNVCMLPLYPGLFVMLANRSGEGASPRSVRWMGVLVLAGIVSCMTAIGFVLHQLSRTASDVLDWLLPSMYLLVLVLGVAMLFGRNPFERLGTGGLPLLRRPALAAYAYGFLLAPMTLPCTGPLIISAFVVGGVAGSGALGESLLYFVWFSLGFGWPLVLLPLVAAPLQRRFTSALTRNHRTIGVASGVLLIVVAAIGLWVDVRPSLFPDSEALPAAGVASSTTW